MNDAPIKNNAKNDAQKRREEQREEKRAAALRANLRRRKVPNTELDLQQPHIIEDTK